MKNRFQPNFFSKFIAIFNILIFLTWLSVLSISVSPVKNSFKKEANENLTILIANLEQLNKNFNSKLNIVINTKLIFNLSEYELQPDNWLASEVVNGYTTRLITEKEETENNLVLIKETEAIARLYRPEINTNENTSLNNANQEDILLELENITGNPEEFLNIVFDTIEYHNKFYTYTLSIQENAICFLNKYKNLLNTSQNIENLILAESSLSGEFAESLIQEYETAYQDSLEIDSCELPETFTLEEAFAAEENDEQGESVRRERIENLISWYQQQLEILEEINTSPTNTNTLLNRLAETANNQPEFFSSSNLNQTLQEYITIDANSTYTKLIQETDINLTNLEIDLIAILKM